MPVPDLEALKQRILTDRKYESHFDSEGMAEEAASIRHKNPEEAETVLHCKEAIDLARQKLTSAKTLDEVVEVITHFCGGTRESVLMDLMSTHGGHPKYDKHNKKDMLGLDLPTEQNKNRKKNESDKPPVEGIPQTHPKEVMESKSLEDTVLDLYEEYKKTGDPKLMEQIRMLSKHVAHYTKGNLEVKLARRKVLKKLVADNPFNKIPCRKAQTRVPNTAESAILLLKENSSGLVLNRSTAKKDPQFDGVWQVTTTSGHRIVCYLPGYNGQKEFDFEVSEPKEERKGQDNLESRVTAREYIYAWAVFIDGKPYVTGIEKSEVPYYKKKALEKLQEKSQQRKSQAPAMNPPALNNYSYSSGGPSQPSQPSQPGGTPPPMPTIPAPAGKRYVLDPTTNTWVLVPINQVSAT